MREQVWNAAMKLQSVMRGHAGRCFFRKRCRQQKLPGGLEWANSPAAADIAASDAEYEAAAAAAAAAYSGIVGHVAPFVGQVNDEGESASTPYRLPSVNDMDARRVISLQAAARGRMGRLMFQARCRQVQEELLKDAS